MLQDLQTLPELHCIIVDVWQSRKRKRDNLGPAVDDDEDDDSYKKPKYQGISKSISLDSVDYSVDSECRFRAQIHRVDSERRFIEQIQSVDSWSRFSRFLMMILIQKINYQGISNSIFFKFGSNLVIGRMLSICLTTMLECLEI